MPEPQSDKRIPRNYDDTMKPTNPPSSMVSSSTRRFVFWSYVGPLLVLFIVIVAGFAYWKHREAAPALHTTADAYAVGTTGVAANGDHGYT
jgi:hypothetical protein